MFVVYALYAPKFNQIYIGYTANLVQRFIDHNITANSGYTVRFRPWTIVYTEIVASKPEALKREKQLKSAQGRLLIRSQVARRIVLFQ